MQSLHCKKRRIPIYLTNKRNANSIFHMKKVDLMNRKQLQLTLLSAYICWKKLCSHTFKDSSEKSNHDVLLQNEGKLHEGGCA